VATVKLCLDIHEYSVEQDDFEKDFQKPGVIGPGGLTAQKKGETL